MKANQKRQKVDKGGKKVEKKGTPPPEGGGRGPAGHSRYISFEMRRKAVKLYLEEGIPSKLVAKEIGIKASTLFAWVKRYREQGEEGLRTTYHPERCRKSNGALTALQTKIVEVKQANPRFGVKRISQLLRRIFFVPASAETVRRTLHKTQLMPVVKRKSACNPSKPRFFERSTPNQMWQSDIFPFHLSGQLAYLIGFIDDHSRYITGLGLYRSQTAENVMEVYRRGTGEYGVPKEMLTDNGRQYTNWRGKTRFENEMQKDRVHHFRSQPHHPQTLGKIERFWKTIWEEFLSRAQFDTFEAARERIAWWVKYYNHQRPHQGIEGLCPADRFFSIQKELGEVMKKGMESNLKELALRGKPQEPVYVVGRVGDRSVMIRSEQGTVRMTVGDREGVKDERNNNGEKESADTAQLQCEGKRDGLAGGMGGATPQSPGVQGDGDQLGSFQQLGKAGDPGDQGGAGGGTGQAVGGVAWAGSAGIAVGIAVGENGTGEGAGGVGKGGGNGSEKLNCRNDAEVCDEDGRVGNGRNEQCGNGSLPCGAGVMVGKTDGGSDLPGDGCDAQSAAAMAGAGDGGDVTGVATTGGPGRRAGTGALCEGETVIGSQGNGTGGTASAVDETSGERECARGDASQGELSGPPRQEVTDEGEGARSSDGPQAGGTDYPGAGGTPECLGGGGPVGGIAQDLLQVGATGIGRDPGGTAGREGGAASCPARSGEGGVAEGSGGASGPGGAAGADPEDPGYAQERVGQ